MNLFCLHNYLFFIFLEPLACLKLHLQQVEIIDNLMLAWWSLFLLLFKYWYFSFALRFLLTLLNIFVPAFGVEDVYSCVDKRLSYIFEINWFIVFLIVFLNIGVEDILIRRFVFSSMLWCFWLIHHFCWMLWLYCFGCIHCCKYTFTRAALFILVEWWIFESFYFLVNLLTPQFSIFQVLIP